MRHYAEQRCHAGEVQRDKPPEIPVVTFKQAIMPPKQDLEIVVLPAFDAVQSCLDAVKSRIHAIEPLARVLRDLFKHRDAWFDRISHSVMPQMPVVRVGAGSSASASPARILAGRAP